MTNRRTWRLVLAAALLPALANSAATAEVVGSGDATTLARAMMRSQSQLAGAALVAVPPLGQPNGVADTELGQWPTAGLTYTVLTTGNAVIADEGNYWDDTLHDLNGPNIRGTSDFDVTILRLDLDAPAGTRCLSFDVQFLTEEFPEFVGEAFNDAFIAELNQSTWTTTETTIVAPDNFARDTDGDPLSVNASGALQLTATEAIGTYDGGTPPLRTVTPVPSGDNNGGLPGNNSLYLSIFDQRDRRHDSAVFLDDLAMSSEGCELATNPPPAIEYTGDEEVTWPVDAAVSATMTDALTLDAVAGRAVRFTYGASTISAATNGQGRVSSTLGIPDAGSSLVVRFDGDFFYPARTELPYFYVEIHTTSLHAAPAILELLPGESINFPRVSAHLVDDKTGQPVSGERVYFTTAEGDEICDALTVSGVATCQGSTAAQVATVAGLGYEATYFGDDIRWYGSSAVGALLTVVGTDVP